MSAKDSYNDFASAQLVVHSRVRVWRAPGIPNPAPGGPKKTGTAVCGRPERSEGSRYASSFACAQDGAKRAPLRAAATREDDKQEIQQDQNRHYDMQDSIGEQIHGELEDTAKWPACRCKIRV
jgi:hypothetical protein